MISITSKPGEAHDFHEAWFAECPQWVNSRILLPARNVRCSLPELPFGLLPRGARSCRYAGLCRDGSSQIIVGIPLSEFPTPF